MAAEWKYRVGGVNGGLCRVQWRELYWLVSWECNGGRCADLWVESGGSSGKAGACEAVSADEDPKYYFNVVIYEID